ncbi:hypothetical protein MTDSW087_00426 [Methylobacterium dankookense]|uniref:Uncharacterized protein n=1 Tax=Methylobacterium dankookense TaxID=560405 RepID=A0A564FSH8_9HYPH|nr:hypothetical protein MTDSW087_00426 [Methylobacterium dankookense]
MAASKAPTPRAMRSPARGIGAGTAPTRVRLRRAAALRAMAWKTGATALRTERRRSAAASSTAASAKAAAAAMSAAGSTAWAGGVPGPLPRQRAVPAAMAGSSTTSAMAGARA